jgi:hypothetical protein
MRLKPNYDESLSKFAFNFSLRRYFVGRCAADAVVQLAALGVSTPLTDYTVTIAAFIPAGRAEHANPVPLPSEVTTT